MEISEPLELLNAWGGVATRMGLVEAILVDMVCEFASNHIFHGRSTSKIKVFWFQKWGHIRYPFLGSSFCNIEGGSHFWDQKMYLFLEPEIVSFSAKSVPLSAKCVPFSGTEHTRILRL